MIRYKIEKKNTKYEYQTNFFSKRKSIKKNTINLTKPKR